MSNGHLLQSQGLAELNSARIGLDELIRINENRLREEEAEEGASKLHVNSSQRKFRPPSELGVEARSLYDRLPDLRFMLAERLVFPETERERES